MTAVIGQGVIEVVADSTKLKAGISDSKTALQSLRDVAKSVGETLTSQSINYIRSLEKQAATIERQAQTFGKSKSEIAAYNAAQMGAGQSAAALVARIEAGEKSLLAQATAAREATAATANLAEQQRLLASIEAKTKPTLPVSEIDAAASHGASIGIAPAKLDPLIAKWRAVEVAADEAAIAEKKSADAAGFLAGLKNEAGAIGKTRSELLQMRAAEHGVTDEAKAYIAQIQAATHHTHEFSLANAGARQELIVLLHELSQGNVKNFGRSLLVLAEQSGAAGFLFSGAAVAVGGLVAVLGTFAVAAFQSIAESKALADALLLTGNYAGQTEGSFDAMAKSIAAASQTTSRAVKSFGSALIATGQIGPQNFKVATEAATRYGQATGKTADVVAGEFASMGQDVAKWAAEHNKQLNFITATEYEQIKALQDSGREVEAAGIVYDALNTHLHALDSNLGDIDRTLVAGAKLWDDFWTAAKGLGKTATIDEELDRLREKLKAFKEGTGVAALLPESVRSRMVDVEQDKVNDAQRRQMRQSETAYAASLLASTHAEGVAARERGDAVLDQMKGIYGLTRARAKDAEMFRRAALDNKAFKPEEIARIERATTEHFAEAPDTSSRQSVLDGYLKGLQQDLEKEHDLVAFAQDRLADLYQHGDLATQQFYDSTKALADDDLKATVETYNKKIAALEKYKAAIGTGSEAGMTPQAKAAAIDAKENEINDLIAARTKAIREAGQVAQVAGGQETRAIEKVTQAYRDAEDAAQSYLDGVRRTNAATLAGMGIGNQERERTSGRAQIEDRYSDQLRALEKTRRDAVASGTFGPDASAKYNDELARIQRFQAASLSEYDTYYAALLAKQQDGNVGASEALRNYADDAKKTAKLVEDAFTNAFSGIEDALVGLLKTGKLNLKSLSDAIYADFAHIVIKQGITGPLASAAQDLFSSAKKTAAPDLSANNVNLFAGAAGAAAGAPAGTAPTLDTTAVRASLASLQSLGIDPTALALQRLQLAANGAASALGLSAGGAGTMPTGTGGLVGLYAGTSSDPTAPNYENSLDQSSTAATATATATTGEQSIANLFKPLQAAQADSAKSADAFGKSAAASASDLALLANAAGRGSGALSLLPSIMQAIAAASTTSGASSGGGGGIFGTLASAVIGAFSGGSPAADSGSVNLFASASPAQYSTISGARAIGGPVSGNSLYQVNERGPELLQVAGKQYLMTGAQGGNVTANADVGRSAEQRPVSVTNNFVLATPASQATQAQVAARAGHGISRAMRRGS